MSAERWARLDGNSLTSTPRGLARILRPMTFERLFRLHAYVCERAVQQRGFPDNLSQRTAVAIRQRMMNLQDGIVAASFNWQPVPSSQER